MYASYPAGIVRRRSSTIRRSILATATCTHNTTRLALGSSRWCTERRRLIVLAAGERR
jgi:hypothetical protein